MSGVSSTADRIAGAWVSVFCERRSPPTPFGDASPCLRSNARHRLTLAALTPKRSPTLRPDPPSATAASTRVRRSIDRGSGIPAGLPSGRKLESLHPRFGNPHPDSISSDGALDLASILAEARALALGRSAEL